jgi:hypothetical protein
MSQMQHEIGHLVTGLVAIACQLGVQRLEAETQS